MGLDTPNSVYRPYYVQGIPIGVQAVDEGPDVGHIHFADGMFLPSAANLTSVMTYGLHYGGGDFEGIRLRLGPDGPYLVSIAANMARLILGHQIVMIHNDPTLRDLIEHGGVLLDQLTPAEFYQTAQKAFDRGEQLTTRYKVGEIVKEKPFLLSANRNFEQFKYRIEHLVAIIQALVFLDRTAFAKYPAYIRPLIFINDLLKIPTAGKMTSLSVATRPWNNYLSDKDYETGVCVLEAPYPRIGDDMPYDAKATGNYENSRLNVNAVALINKIIGNVLGYNFGEVIVRNRTGEFVEGSAENLAAFKKVGNSWIVITPPVGKETGILAGTTRHRFIEWCEKNNIKIEFRGITEADLTEAKALVMMGTGAGIIHVRSIVKFNLLRKIMDAYKGMRSEISLPDYSPIKSLLEGGYSTIPINDGVKDPIVDKVQKELSDIGSKLPVWRINFSALAEAIEIPLEEMVPSALQAKLKDQAILSDSDKRDFRAKMQDAERICKQAYNIGMQKIPDLRRERLKRLCG